MLPYLQFEFENKWLPTTSLLNTLGLCIFSIQNNLLKPTVNIILFSVVRDFWKTLLIRRICWGFHLRRSVTKSTNLNLELIPSRGRMETIQCLANPRLTSDGPSQSIADCFGFIAIATTGAQNGTLNHILPILNQIVFRP